VDFSIDYALGKLTFLTGKIPTAAQAVVASYSYYPTSSCRGKGNNLRFGGFPNIRGMVQ
jgi:hypothetical protein